MYTVLGNATSAQLLTLLETEKRVSVHISRQLLFTRETLKSRRLVICLLQKQKKTPVYLLFTNNGFHMAEAVIHTIRGADPLLQLARPLHVSLLVYTDI